MQEIRSLDDCEGKGISFRGRTVKQVLLAIFLSSGDVSTSNILVGRLNLPAAYCFLPLPREIRLANWVDKPKYLSHGVNCLLIRWRRRVGIEPT